MKKHQKYIVGIDCGASKTEIIVIEKIFPPLRKGGRGVLSFSFPAINYNLLEKEKIIDRITTILKKVTKKIKHENISSVGIGIAGARYNNDRNQIKLCLSGKLNIKNIKILTDTEIALASVFDKNEKNCGILIAGTGSILYYRNRMGKIKRIGGWGRHIGDEGSGYWIGKEALNHVTKCYDGYGEKTILLKELKKHHDIHVSSLIKKVYHENMEISKIAKHVFDCAESGDKVSLNIIKKAAEHLANHFKVLKKTKMKIGLLGSLFSEEKLLEKYLRLIVKKKYPNVQLIKPDKKPVWGAVKIGLEYLKSQTENS